MIDGIVMMDYPYFICCIVYKYVSGIWFREGSTTLGGGRRVSGYEILLMLHKTEFRRNPGLLPPFRKYVRFFQAGVNTLI